MNSNLAENEAVITDNINDNVKENKKVSKITYRIIKRFIDIIGGIIGSFFLVPLTFIVEIARLVCKENDGPLFYEQLRIGKNGKQFRLYKFRSMVIDADEKLNIYLEENEDAKKEYQKYKKLKNDPRITKVGKTMRKFSIDEFPQFINVLKGDMSLVGPRPYLPKERKDMGEAYETIITVKPGITGFWQINGRNDIDFKERTEMDVNYVNTKTLWFDIKILIRTVFKIFDREGN